MAGLASIWVLTYAILGLWESAAIPLAYQLASAASIGVFAWTTTFDDPVPTTIEVSPRPDAATPALPGPAGILPPAQ